jgi:hypothetical protein
MLSQTILPDVASLAGQSFTPSTDMVAMELITMAGGTPSLGPVSKIPHGCNLEYCGSGFDRSTVKVRWRGKFYFIFLDDLQNQCPSATQSSDDRWSQINPAVTPISS